MTDFCSKKNLVMLQSSLLKHYAVHCKIQQSKMVNLLRRKRGKSRKQNFYDDDTFAVGVDYFDDDQYYAYLRRAWGSECPSSNRLMTLAIVSTVDWGRRGSRITCRRHDVRPISRISRRFVVPSLKLHVLSFYYLFSYQLPAA